MNEGFHTFALWWTPEIYVFYVDGEETWRTTAGGVCQVPMYAKLTDEIGKWADRVAHTLYRERQPLFLHKHYNEAYPFLSLIEDSEGK